MVRRKKFRVHSRLRRITSGQRRKCLRITDSVRGFISHHSGNDTLWTHDGVLPVQGYLTCIKSIYCSLIKSQTIYDGLRHRCVFQPGIYANQQFSQHGHEKKNRHINKKACASSTSNFLCECFLLIQSEMMDRGHVTLIIKQAA